MSQHQLVSTKGNRVEEPRGCGIMKQREQLGGRRRQDNGHKRWGPEGEENKQRVVLDAQDEQNTIAA